MIRSLLLLVGLALGATASFGCGLDWTLPTNHFDGVEEHGYVSYWEKIGEADFGDGLVIPVNINFDSHRESVSPSLGKGWMVALLESHVEPIDENSVNVIMPDGWTFIFFRNGSTETWRGNAGWVGETNNTAFAITAPCGWKIKFDEGKIREIDTNTGRTLSFKYNGPQAAEMDVDNKALVQVESDSSTGIAKDLIIGGQKIDIELNKRPRVQLVGKQNFVTGFDPSLSSLQWSDGKKESFAFGTDKSLDPTLAITHPDQTVRNLAWDATTRIIQTDGSWNYQVKDLDDGATMLSRSDLTGKTEIYEADPNTGSIIEQGADGVERVTKIFSSGILRGKIRQIETVKDGIVSVVYSASYDEKARLLRERGSRFEEDRGAKASKSLEFVTKYKYDEQGRLVLVTVNGDPTLTKSYDNAGRLKDVTYPNHKVKSTFFYISDGLGSIPCMNLLTNLNIPISQNTDKIEIRMDAVFGQDILVYNQKGGVDYRIDHNNEVLRYVFDNLGRQSALYKDGKLVETYVYTLANNQLQRKIIKENQ